MKKSASSIQFAFPWATLRHPLWPSTAFRAHKKSGMYGFHSLLTLYYGFDCIWKNMKQYHSEINLTSPYGAWSLSTPVTLSPKFPSSSFKMYGWLSVDVFAWKYNFELARNWLWARKSSAASTDGCGWVCAPWWLCLHAFLAELARDFMYACVCACVPVCVWPTEKTDKQTKKIKD